MFCCDFNLYLSEYNSTEHPKNNNPENVAFKPYGSHAAFKKLAECIISNAFILANFYMCVCVFCHWTLKYMSNNIYEVNI